VDKAGMEQTETTPDKNQDEDKSNCSSTDKKDAIGSPKDSEKKDADGFQTPSRKHRASAASIEAVLAKEDVMEMHNSYTALTSLGMTRSQGPSPKKTPTDNRSPQKKKSKEKLKFSI
jgi:hypothetical protein